MSQVQEQQLEDDFPSNCHFAEAPNQSNTTDKDNQWLTRQGAHCEVQQCKRSEGHFHPVQDNKGSAQHKIMLDLSLRPELEFIAKPERTRSSLSNSLLLASLFVTFLPGWISQSSLQPALWPKILPVPPSEDVIPIWLRRASLPLCASLA